MKNDKNYNRFEINENYSMGENGLLFYEDIMEKNAFNKIILSSILNLHKKKHLEINTNEKNELIIKIISSNKPLKKSELFIYECLKHIDKDENGTITLNEFNASKNTIFSKNKKSIKELIIQESMDDELIDKDKYKMKSRCFFRTIEILFFLLFSILEYMHINFSLLLLIVVSLFSAIENSDKLKLKNDLNRLKKSLIDSDIIKYGSKDVFSTILIEIGVCIILFFANNYILHYIDYLVPSILILAIEAIILLFYAVKIYIKFMKTDIITDTANTQKQNLKGLANFLKDYSLIENRKSIEIHLWDTYLILSVLLDINKTIPKELKIELSNNNERKIQFDYYENKYYYINNLNEKIYTEIKYDYYEQKYFYINEQNEKKYI